MRETERSGGQAGRPEPPRRALRRFTQPAVPRRWPELGVVTEAAAEVQREAAHGGHRRDGTRRDGTSAPPPKAVAPAAPRRRRSSPPLPGSGSVPPGAPQPSSSSAPPPPRGRAAPPAPAPRPGAARPRRSAERGGGSGEAAAVEEGQPGPGGRLGESGPGRGTPSPLQPGSPEGGEGDSSPHRQHRSCPPRIFGQGTAVGGAGSPMGRPPYLPLSCGETMRERGFWPILPSTGGAGGAGLGGRDGWWMKHTRAARPKTQRRARGLATVAWDAQQP